MKKLGKFSDRMRMTLDFYVEDGCKSQEAAMLRAGYSNMYARTQQHMVFKNPVFVAELEKRFKKLETKAEFNAEYVRKRIFGMLEAKPGELYREDMERLFGKPLTQDQIDCLQSVKVVTRKEGRGKDAPEIIEYKINFDGPVAAVAIATRVLGMNQDKMTVDGSKSLVDMLMAARKRVRDKRKEGE